MNPLDRLTAAEARALEGIAFDLDDTVLDHGHLREEAYRALFRLREAGLRLIAVTGRSAMLARVLAGQWPVEAAIAENGAVFAARDEAGVVRLHDPVAPAERALRQHRLREMLTKLCARFEALGPADDNPGRVSDLALDHGEHRLVEPRVVEAARAEAERLGVRTTASSVHVHLSFDAADKASGLVAYLRGRGADPTVVRSRFAFIGDSENDAPAFAAFTPSFGVANVRARLGKLSVPPRFVASKPMGLGFAEVADTLARLRA